MWICHAKVPSSSGLLKRVIVHTLALWCFAGSVDVSALWCQKWPSVFPLSVPGSQFSKNHKTDKHLCLDCIKECELWRFSKHALHRFVDVHPMIYELEVMGLNVMWFCCQWKVCRRPLFFQWPCFYCLWWQRCNGCLWNLLRYIDTRHTHTSAHTYSFFTHSYVSLCI